MPQVLSSLKARKIEKKEPRPTSYYKQQVIPHLLCSIRILHFCFRLTKHHGNSSEYTRHLDIMASEFPCKLEYSLDLGWHRLLDLRLVEAESALERVVRSDKAKSTEAAVMLGICLKLQKSVRNNFVQ